MRPRKPWNPAQTSARDQILSVLHEHGELSVTDLRTKVADVFVVDCAGDHREYHRNLRPGRAWDFTPESGLLVSQHSQAGRVTNHLLVLVTAGLVQVRRETPKSLKMWSLTEQGQARFLSINDMPPLVATEAGR